MTNAHIPKRAIQNLWGRIEKGMERWDEIIQLSFISKDLKTQFLNLISSRKNQIGF